MRQLVAGPAVGNQARGETQVSLGKVIGWIVGILLVVWIVSNPSIAGDTVRAWVDGIITFFQHVAA